MFYSIGYSKICNLHILKQIYVKNYITNKILSFALLLQIILVGVASRQMEWVEKYYSNGIYPVISGFLRRLIGWIPVSVGDLLYGIFLLIILRWIWLLVKTRMAPFREHLYSFLASLSVLFFIFHIFWGLNYYREPLYRKLKIDSLDYTSEQLLNTTKKHINKLNTIHLAIVKNDSLAIEVPYKRRKIYKIASNTYRQFYIDSIDFNFKVKSIKSSLFSGPLSYMGFSGYLNPFTGESQVNRKIPLTDYPATTCHEMAHQLGYAPEDEANYVGYLASINNEDLYFQFSGELLAVRHLLYSLEQLDKDSYEKLSNTLNPGIKKNMQITHDFWDSYQNPFEPYFKKFYDLFLKANKQEEGIQSYNAMVGYLVNDSD